MAPWLKALNQGKQLITVNSRLCDRLHDEFCLLNPMKNKVFERPPIHSLGQWLNQIWEIFEGLAWVDVQLLSPFQELAIWENILETLADEHALMHIRPTAKMASAAWSRLVKWQIPLNELKQSLGEDSLNFYHWALAFQHRLEKEKALDSASLMETCLHIISEHPEIIQQHEVFQRPICLWGFDDWPPQSEVFFSKLKEWGISVNILEPIALKHSRVFWAGFEQQEEEWWACLNWLKPFLDQPSIHPIGIVVPNLPDCRRELDAFFKAHLNEGHRHRGPIDQISERFNLSAGTPLAHQPIIHCALNACFLLTSRITMGQMEALLGSAFFFKGLSALLFHAQALELWKKEGILEFVPEALEGHMGWIESQTQGVYWGWPTRLQELIAWKAKVQEKGPVRYWKRVFETLWHHLDWPGERQLTSIEHQAVSRWQHLCEEWLQLDALLGELDVHQAIDSLSKIAHDVPFQPQSAQVPIHVLGALEAGGHSFRALWVMGLTHEHWPPPAAPNPFLPMALQRKYNMPHASPARELAFCQKLTQRFATCAPEVVFSYPKRDGASTFLPSPLILGFEPYPLKSLPRPMPPLNAQLKCVEDAIVPVDKGETIRGGSDILKLQAQCPFKAFSVIRLGVKEEDHGPSGHLLLKRGILLHETLEALWAQLKNSSQLKQMKSEVLGEMIQNAIDTRLASFTGAFPSYPIHQLQAIEKKRLAILIHRWLSLEKTRPDFQVLEQEKWHRLSLSGLKLKLRLDRVDKLADGQVVIIDYKSGSPSLSACLGDRPDEPQLLLYSLSHFHAQLAGVALAQVNYKQCQFVGIVEGEALPQCIPPSKVALNSAKELSTLARQTLEPLVTEFLSGIAWVDPKRGRVTCQNCHLPPFCRIYSQETHDE